MLRFLGHIFVLNVFLSFLTISIMGQTDDSAQISSDSVVSNNITVGIVEPYVIYDILVIKNIITDAIKDEFEGKYDYFIIENDSTLETRGDYQYIDMDRIISRSQKFNFLLITKHTTVQVDHLSISYSNVRTFDSIIEMIIYDQNCIQRTQSTYDFIPSMHFRLSNKGVKRAKKASKAAAKSMVKEIDKLVVSTK